MSNWWSVGLDTSDLQRDAERAKKMMSDMNNSMLAESKKVEAAFQGARNAILGIFTLQAAQSFVSDIVRVRSEFQSLNVSFTTMLGNKERADALMGQLVKTAAITPFSMQEIANGAKQLLAYQVSAEEVNDSLVRLGNIASGIGVPLSRLILVYGQVRAKGKLMGDDLRQFTEAGIPMVAELAKQFGVSESAISGMVSAGKIGFKDVQSVINNLTNSGGMFYNLMAEKSKTLEGQISNLGDSWDQMLNQLGQSSEGVISDAIGGVAVLVDNYEAVGEAIAVLIAAYGTYKAALLANLVVEEVTQAMLLQRRLATVELTATQAFAAAATTSWTAAMRALNASMLANPYVLVAAGITAIGYGVYKLATYQDEAEKAQTRLNDSFKEFQNSAGSEISKLSRLVGELEGTKRGTEQYKAAKDKIISQYGQYDANLSKEIDKVGNLETVYKNLVSAINKSFGARQYSKFLDDQQKALEDTMSDNLDEIYDKLLGKFGDKVGSKYYTQIRSALLEGKDIPKELDGIIKQLYGIWGQNLFVYVKNIKDAQKATESANKAAKVKFGVDADPKQTETVVKQTTAIKSFSEQLAEAKKRVTDIKDAIKNLRSGKSVSQNIAKDLQDKTKELKEAEEAVNVLTGKDDKKDKKAESDALKIKKDTADYKMLLSQQSKERKRANEDLENQLAQSRIDAMNVGSGKEIAQMQLNHLKEMQTLDRQQQDLLQKHKDDAKAAFDANPANKKKTFNASSIVLSAEENKTFDNMRVALRAKQSLDDDKFYKDLNDKYQDYTAQRVALETRFNADIAALQEERSKTTDENQRQSIDRSIAEATKQKGQALANLDYEQLKKTPEYVRAFENLKQTSTETLNSLLAKLEEAKVAAAQTMDPAALREYTTTIQDVMTELEQRNPFAALAQKKTELAEAEKELAVARKLLDESQSGDDNGGTFDDEGKFISTTQAADKYRIALDKVTQKKAQVVSSQKATDDIFQKLASSISNVGQSIGGLSGDIIGMMGSMVSTVSATVTGLDTIDKTLSTTMKTIEKSSIILAAISAAYQIGSKIASLFTGQDKKQYESMKQNYESLIGVWDTLIDKKLEYLNASTGQEAKKAEQEALDMLNKQVEATRQMALERLKVKNGGHSMEYRMWLGSYSFNGKTWDDVATQITAATGKAVNSMRDFTNLSSDELKWIRENYVGLWSSMDDDFRKYLEQIIDYGDKVGDVTKQTKESLTQMTFDDVRNNFLDALSDMDASSEDLANNVEKYLQKAILNSMMSEKYQKKLKEWYDSFAQANENGIDSSEYDKLKDEYNNIVNDAIAERDKLKDVFGWKGENSDSSTTGVSGQLKDAMTEGTASQLVGLWNITAMDIRATKDLLYSILGGDSLKVTVDHWEGMPSLLDATRQIQANTYRTANNTDNLVPTLNKMNDKLDDIVKNTKNSSSRG